MDKFKMILSNILNVLSCIFGMVFMISICCNSETNKGITIIGITIISSLLLTFACRAAAEKLERSRHKRKGRLYGK